MAGLPLSSSSSNLLKVGKWNFNQKDRAKTVLVAYCCYILFYFAMLLFHDQINYPLIALNGTVFSLIAGILIIPAMLHLDNTHLLKKRSVTTTCYVICTLHVICQILMNNIPHHSEADQMYASCLCFALPLGLGLACNNISILILLGCQVCICSSRSFSAFILLQSVEIHCYIWAEFFLIVLIFAYNRQSFLDTSEEGVQVDVVSPPQHNAVLKKASFIAQVAHDFGTPLTIFSLTVQSLLLTNLSEEQSEMVEALECAIDLMTVVRIDALDIDYHVHGKNPTPSLQPVSLWTVVKKCESVICYYTGAADVPVEFFVSPDVLCKLELDFDWVFSMMMQLLTNAKQYSFQGKVTVTIFAIYGETAMATVNRRKNDFDGIITRGNFDGPMQFRIEVADQGVGVPREKQNELFKPFSQLGKESGGGIGLGLHGVATKSKILGGQAGMRPNLMAGRGSIFWIELPFEPSPCTPKTGRKDMMLGWVILHENARKVLPLGLIQQLHFLSLAVDVASPINFSTHSEAANDASVSIYAASFPNTPYEVSPQNFVTTPQTFRPKWISGRSSLSNTHTSSSNHQQSSYLTSLLQWAKYELSCLESYTGRGLSIIVLFVNDDGKDFVDALQELQDSASSKNWQLLCGTRRDVRNDLLGMITRFGCKFNRDDIVRSAHQSNDDDSSITESRSSQEFNDVHAMEPSIPTLNLELCDQPKQSRKSSMRFLSTPRDPMTRGRITLASIGNSQNVVDAGPPFARLSSAQRSHGSSRGISDSSDGSSVTSKDVLLISDSKPRIKMLLFILQKSGISTYLALDPEKAMEMVKERQYLALIILFTGKLFDWHNLVERIRNLEAVDDKRKHNRIILLEESGEDPNSYSDHIDLVDYFLPKPYSFPQIYAAIKGDTSRPRSFSCNSPIFRENRGHQASFLRITSRSTSRSTARSDDSASLKNTSRSTAMSDYSAPTKNAFSIKSTKTKIYCDKSLPESKAEVKPEIFPKPTVSLSARKTNIDLVSTYSFQPLSPGSKKENFNSFEKQPQVEHQPRHVLVVEDEKTLRKYLSYMLRKRGFEVTTCPNGLEGLNKMKEMEFEGVLMDQNMPVMNGLDCIKRFRQWEEISILGGIRMQRQRIIMLSANAAKRDQAIAIESGANLFLPKPFKIDEIIAAIEKQ